MAKAALGSLIFEDPKARNSGLRKHRKGHKRHFPKIDAGQDAQAPGLIGAGSLGAKPDG
jgi:hypothetical protein